MELLQRRAWAFLPLWSVVGLITPSAQAEERHYALDIRHEAISIAGKDQQVMTVNGGIPGPVLEFNEGDTAVIKVTNHMKVDSSVHWHGILLPNEQDGVPYLTTPPIKAEGGTLTYRFTLKQSGTYWYHSHTGLQEQRGVYGAILIHPRAKEMDTSAADGADASETASLNRATKDHVVVLSDWTRQNPNRIMRMLKRGSHWFQIKKGYAFSLDRLLKHKALGGQAKMWWQRMPGMDISDVYYDAFLSNGEKHSVASGFEPGDRVRVRLVNASASTYFWLTASASMTVVGADGVDVEPFETDTFLQAIAETYDVLVTIPESGGVEFRAAAQDGSGETSFVVGKDGVAEAPKTPRPDLMAMTRAMASMKHQPFSKKRDGEAAQLETPRPLKTSHEEQHQHMQHEHHGHGGHAGHDMSWVMKTPYEQLKALDPIDYPDEAIDEITLNLSGNMVRYVWSFNGNVLSEVDKIPVKPGRVLRITLNNTTMMHHPIHLHGYFFRVLTAQGERSPLKHTVDVPPMGSRTIEFEASAEGEWIFHCHVLYHMKSGMTRVFSERSGPIPHNLMALRRSGPKPPDKHWYPWATTMLASHMGAFNGVISNTRNAAVLSAEVGRNGLAEGSLDYERFTGRFSRVFAGANFEHESEDFDWSTDDVQATLGFREVLPMLVDFEARVGHLGEAALALDYEVLVFPRLEAFGEYELEAQGLWDSPEVELEHQWQAGVEWILGGASSLSASYDNRFGAGAGFVARF